MAARPGSVEEVRALVDEMGIEFSFAQFVEMYGKPNAKLVPTTHLEDMFRDGAGFAGFATGELGQGPNDPDIAAMPDPGELHAGAVAAEPRAVRVRRLRRGRAVARTAPARS